MAYALLSAALRHLGRKEEAEAMFQEYKKREQQYEYVRKEE